MAITYVWPGTLPQLATVRYSESGGALILRTPMDAGPAKMRRRGHMPKPLSVEFQMTSTQIGYLEAFVYTTLRGTSRFGFPHPRTGAQVEVRIVPADDGKLFSIGYLAPNFWAVSLSLEVLP